MQRVTAGALAIGLAALAGCGGEERQDADEPRGTFRVQVLDASFPERQRLAQQEEMTIRVRNAGGEAVPNVAVTVDSFSFRSQQAGLADPERPNFIVDAAPRGGTTAYAGTWALGRLAPGQTRDFTWRVTAVRPGTHTIRWRVAAGLDGKARAVGTDGRQPAGQFDVRVSDRPPASRVDPETGRVVRGDDE
jgi:hypothetical protein